METGILLSTLKAHSKFIQCMCISPNGEKIISGGYNGKIKIWNAKNGILINTLDGHKYCVNSVCISLDGKRIISRRA